MKVFVLIEGREKNHIAGIVVSVADTLNGAIEDYEQKTGQLHDFARQDGFPTDTWRSEWTEETRYVTQNWVGWIVEYDVATQTVSTEEQRR